MEITKRILILVTCVYLSGCATGAQIQGMTYQGSQKTYSDKLKGNMEISSVIGGKETSPLGISDISNESFSNAVKQSLSDQGLLSDNGRYQLEIQILEIDKPFFGVQYTVTTRIQYILSDTTNNSIVLSETIVARYTADMSDAFLGSERLRLANEGSGKRSIESFIKKLTRLRIKPREITFVQ